MKNHNIFYLNHIGSTSNVFFCTNVVLGHMRTLCVARTLCVNPWFRGPTAFRSGPNCEPFTVSPNREPFTVSPNREPFTVLLNREPFTVSLAKSVVSWPHCVQEWAKSWTVHGFAKSWTVHGVANSWTVHGFSETQSFSSYETDAGWFRAAVFPKIGNARHQRRVALSIIFCISYV